jgi:microsomal dipeptidase-like Zn-dependent dipeptidase
MVIKQKLIYALGSILIIAAIVVFAWLPEYVEKSRNRVSPSQNIEISAAAKKLHQSLFIVDLHSDSLLWNRDLAKKSKVGHVDIPRLIEGNIGLQVFSVVTKTPKNLNLLKNSDATDNITLLAFAQLWPPNTWFSLFERAEYQANKLHQIAKAKNEFYVISNQEELTNYLLQRKKNPQITAGLLSLEGAHALEGKLENLDRLYEMGFRIIGFTHFFDNALGGSAHGINKDGISDFGKQVLKRLDELEMFVDISHASPALVEDIFKLSKRPILATHTGVQGVCASKSTRNLSDRQIKQIAASGGIIGIGFWPTATCGKSITGIVQSIRYVKNLVGVDYVALGSDFDGNVLVPFTSSNIEQLTHALLKAEFSKAHISKIMGGNLQRVFSEHLPNH